MQEHWQDCKPGVGSAGTALGSSTTESGWRLQVFARMWACAALFNLAGNAREALTTSAGFAVASAALALGAALTMLAPYRRRWLYLLCASTSLTAWYEAPVVGNHWVLASAISLALLLSFVPRRTASCSDLDRAWLVFSRAARMSLLIAYGFAAFAKLNSDFFDPAVSCAVYYHNQLVGSWNLHLLEVTSSAPGRSLAVTAAAVEACVALGLAIPRTRRVSLVLAVSFHWLLAMDLHQHFWDFSAVLFAVFLLFLDDEQVARLREGTNELFQRQVVRPAWLSSAVVAMSVVVASLAVLPVPTTLDVTLVLLGHLAWWIYGTAVVAVVAFLFFAPRSSSRQPRAALGLVYLVPALVLLNGLTPYLELKTGFGWNMYSNLRTVAGVTNHLIVPATADLTGLQTDRVEIIASSDPALRKLGSDGYALTYTEFRKYAQTHPDVAVTYERDGRVVRAERLEDDPAAAGATSALARRLQSFRVIDLSPAERCQPSFSPAR